MKKIKKFVAGISLALAGSVLIGCKPGGNPPEAPLVFQKLDIEKESVNLSLGEEKALSVEVKANKETFEEKVQWTSSNEAVVTVDENGKLVAVGPGTAVITAKIGDLTDTCSVVVSDKEPTYMFVGLSKKMSFVTSCSYMV